MYFIYMLLSIYNNIKKIKISSKDFIIKSIGDEFNGKLRASGELTSRKSVI